MSLISCKAEHSAKQLKEKGTNILQVSIATSQESNENP